MGADGGTIPKRCELVKNKKKSEKLDKNVKNASKWRMCQLSQQPLRKPIIACRFGRLYNKEAVLEGLIEGKLKSNAVTRHIKSKKDFKDLKLTANRAFKGDGVNSDESYVDHNETPYICPVTSIGMNGTNVFTVNWKCGCVISEKAIQEVPSETCHGCGGPFEKEKLVVLNPPDELLKKYEAELEQERAAKKAAKAAKSAEGVSTESTSESVTVSGSASSSKSMLASVSSEGCKKTAPKRKAEGQQKSIQDDATASKVYKSLFTSSDAAKARPQAHWDMRVLSCLLALLCASCIVADRVLVLIDDAQTRTTHSLYLKSLQDRGHSVTIKMADDSSLSLIKYGEFLYEHLVILAPSVDEFGGTVSVPEIVKFIDGGGNVLVAGGNNLGDAIRELALENGFEFDDSNTAVIDHLNYDSALDDGTHTSIVLPASQLISAQMIAGDKKKLAPVLYKGVALVADESNRLKLEILTAATTAYSANPKTKITEYPAAVGKSTILIGALQARNNARVVFTGSLDMFSDKFLNANVYKVGNTQKAPKSGNLDLVTELSKWVLKEKGVLRVKSVSHHKVGEVEPPREYTINDKVEYKIDIEEFANGKWVPFQGDDVQMEFVRIDPFVRLPLYNTNGLQKAVFNLPDVYGVFKFIVDYRRVGYTHLYDVQQVSVRPLQHTQYERFIPSAYPYYASSFSMMAGVVVFSLVFLHHKDQPAPGLAGAKSGKKD